MNNKTKHRSIHRRIPSNILPQVFATLALSIAATIATSPAWAITGTSDSGADGSMGTPGTASGAMFPAVGKINIPKDLDGAGPFLGSATLIGPMHMVTAAHNFSVNTTTPKTGRHTTNGTAMFQVPDGTGTKMISVDYMRVKLHDMWDGKSATDHDIAVIKLKKNIKDVLTAASLPDTAVTPMMLGTATNEVGMPVTFVGWGSTNGNTTGTKRHGSNEVDNTANGGNTLKADVDNDGTDAGTAPGDSGGAWIKDGKLIGVTSYGMGEHGSTGLPRHTATPSVMQFGTRISQFTGWINTAIGELQVANMSGPSTLDSEYALASSNPGTLYPGVESDFIDQTNQSLGLYKLEFAATVPVGGQATFATQLNIFNDTGIVTSQVNLEFGTGGFDGEPFIPVTPGTGGFLGPTSATPPDDPSFALFPEAPFEPGPFENMLLAGFLPDQQVANPFFAFEVRDDIDGVIDGMANFTIQQTSDTFFDMADLNNDGVRNALDIDPIVHVLTGGESEFSFRADANGDGFTNALDIPGLTTLLSGSPPPPGFTIDDLIAMSPSSSVPEPTSAALLMLGGFTCWRRPKRHDKPRSTKTTKHTTQTRPHTKSIAALIAICCLIIAAPTSNAAIMYLSLTAPGGGATLSNPTVNLSPGASTTMHVYFVPGAADAPYNAVALNVTAATSGVVSATSLSVLNPDITVGGADSGLDRWNGTGGSLGTDPALITNMNGVNISMRGLRVGDDGSGVFLDAGYDATASAFHIGSFTLMAASTAVPLSTTLSMSVGSTLTARVGDTALSGPPIQFGAGDTTVSGTIAGGTGSFADATINVVIPEPAAISLILLGSLSMFTRRQKA